MQGDKVEEYLSTPTKHHMHLRSRKNLPGHFFGQYVPTTLPSSELGGIANLASLIDVCDVGIASFRLLKAIRRRCDSAMSTPFLYMEFTPRRCFQGL